MVQSSSGLSPFNRDRLLVSIYEACKHRQNALEDATGLTQTVVSDTLKETIAGSVIQREKILLHTKAVLGRFDTTAATVYSAYHK